ncbi:MAG: hypothetical protein PHV34_13410 [Verrucomicrobiae bacterium]|nr:hypothetical protein [Verrucomicrobiae bacterium]
MNYAKVAKLAGDIEEYKNGIYRSAKRALPTVMRFYFHEYINKTAYESNNRYGNNMSPMNAVFGFKEWEGVFAVSAVPVWYARNTVDFFEISQGTSDDLVLLYKSYCPEAAHEYLFGIKKDAILSDGEGKNVSYEMLKPYVMFGADSNFLDFLLKSAEKWTGEKSMLDWVGMRQADFIGAMIYRNNPKIFLDSWSPAYVKKAEYDPENKMVKLDFEFSMTANNYIRLFSRLQPKSVDCNGELMKNAEDWIYNGKNGMLELKKLNSDCHLKIKFGHETEAWNPMLEYLVNNHP